MSLVSKPMAICFIVVAAAIFVSFSSSLVSLSTYALCILLIQFGSSERTYDIFDTMISDNFGDKIEG